MLWIEQPVARAANITVRPHSQVTAVHGTRRLEALTIRDSNTGTAETLPTAALFILIGAEPHPRWLANAAEATTTGSCDRPRPAPGAQAALGLTARPAAAATADQPAQRVRAADLCHGSIKQPASAVGEGAAVHLDQPVAFFADQVKRNEAAG
jgi:thioredoxin reductase (NADPH)